MLFGGVVFALLRQRRPTPSPRNANASRRMRPLGADEQSELVGAKKHIVPFSQRLPRVSDIRELRQFEDVDQFEFPEDHACREDWPSLHESVAPEDIGALFLGRVTEALSPFGIAATHNQFELEQFAFESGTLGEATARAANGEEGFEPESAPESERRPSPIRGRARS